MDRPFTAGDFQPHLKSAFTLNLETGAVNLDLVEVTETAHGAREGGAFSLLWEGPLDPVLEQGIYTLAHDAMGAVEVFIVPVGQVDEITQYEAVFT